MSSKQTKYFVFELDSFNLTEYLTKHELLLNLKILTKNNYLNSS